MAPDYSLPDQITTSRLLLRPPRTTDAAALFAQYTQCPDVAKFMTWTPHQALAETIDFLAAIAGSWERNQEKFYLLESVAEPGAAIGCLSARLGPSGQLEVGFVLAPALWGRGLMPEAVRGFVECAFSTGWCYRVQATCDIENTASARTLEKAAFRREGILRGHLVRPNLDPSAPRDSYLYAIT